MQNLLPQAAAELLHNRPEAVLIDCRSEMEYMFVGHPPGVLLVPWYDGPDWELNPQFLGAVRKAASHQRPVVLLCRSGNRSREAGAFLEQHGFSEVYNVLHGFEGDLNEQRQRSSKNGWRFEGLPWEQG